MRSFLKRYLFDGEILRLMGLVALVKPLGLVTQMLIAKYFGAGPRYDAYSLALFIVSFSATVLGNVFTSTAIPFVIKMRTTLAQKDLLRFQNGVVLLFLLPAVIITLALIAAPGTVIRAVGRGLPPETSELAADMVRWMAIPGMLLLAGIMGKAVLNLNRNYQLAASMPLVNAVLSLAAVMALHGRFGIWSLVIGFGVSNLIQAGWQWWATGRFRYAAPLLPTFPAGTRRTLWSLSWMLLVSQAIILVYQFLDKMFAASLAPGSISSIAYANTIVMFGIQLFTLTQVTVMFTRISEMISQDDIRGCSDYILDNIRRIARLAVPFMLALCVASDEIVRVLFQRGEFTAADAALTSGALSLYILGLVAFVLNQVSARVFHALQRMKERIWLAVQYLVTKILLNVLLVGSYGVNGLAVSSTLAIYSHVALSLWILNRYGLGLEVGRWSRVLILHHLLAGATYAIYTLVDVPRRLWSWHPHDTLTGNLLVGSGKGLAVLAIYGVLFLAWRRFLKNGRAW